MRNLITILCSFLLLGQIQAQCNIHHFNSQGNFNLDVGQSFTTTCDGEITTIEVLLNGGSPAIGQTCNMDIFAGETCSGTSLGSTSTPLVAGWNTFTFSPPVSVNNATQYSFFLDGPNSGVTWHRSHNANYYAGGNLLANCAVWNLDLIFEIPIAPPPAPIPTMGEWGLIILCLNILIIGTIFIRKFGLSGLGRNSVISK